MNSPHVYYNDIDPYCCKVLQKNIRLGNLPEGYVDGRDIREVTPDDLMGYNHIHLFAGIGGFPLGLQRANFPRSIRILTGGFPCQDISQGNQIDPQGLDGDRSGLWAEYYRLICGIRPDYILVENVSALLYRGFDRVLGDLAGIGYDAEWGVFQACDFGLPHRRRRVLIVAYPSSQRRVCVLKSPIATHQQNTFYQRKQRQTQVSKVVALRHVLSQAESMLSQPSVCGMDDGLPDWVDSELRGLGNAIIPKLAEHAGHCIMHAAEMESAGVA